MISAAAASCAASFSEKPSPLDNLCTFDLPSVTVPVLSKAIARALASCSAKLPPLTSTPNLDAPPMDEKNASGTEITIAQGQDATRKVSERKMNSLNEQLNGVKTRIDKLFQDQEAECRKDPEVSKWMDRREKKWNEIKEMTADLKQKFPDGRPDSSDRDGTAYWNNTQSFIESAWKDHDAANRHYNEAAAPIHEKYDKKYSDLIKERKGVESELEHQQKLLHQLHQRYTRRARQLGEEDFDE